MESPPQAVSPQRRQRRRVSKRSQQLFLDAYARGALVVDAAHEAGHPKASLYALAKRDPEFAAAWQALREPRASALEDEMVRRGVDGWDEPVFQGGKQVGVVRKYSDRCLELAHRAVRPELYGTRVELTGRDGGPVEMQADYRPTTLADVVRLARELGAVDVLEGEAVEVAELDAGSPRVETGP